MVVQVAAEPNDTDVVFLPTDDQGTPGELNSIMLMKLGLPRKLPGPSELAKGHSFQRTKGGLICYIVTVGLGSTEQLLNAHLREALASSEMRNARSIWLPLMGTGAGGLPFDESFNITLNALRDNGWFSRTGVLATISLPAEAWDLLVTTIYKAKQTLADGAEAESEPASDPYKLPSSPAVESALVFAAELGKLHKGSKRRLSSTLLFFALAESQSSAAPDALVQDGAADFFASAVRELAGDRYAQAWNTYFGTNEHQGAPPRTSSSLPRPTNNVSAILRTAARAAGATAITIDHLVTALLQKEETRLLKVLEQMGVEPGRLLKEYTDARFGGIITKFRNDVASDKDRLGYDTYARAITDFLTHVDTPPPLSISIQAPWGAANHRL